MHFFQIFLDLDAWLSALLFAAVMLGSWLLGVRIGRKFGKPGDAGRSTRIEDAGLALFGLLMAFCFSGAAGRYEARKDFLREDAMAIGELADVSASLEEPERSEMHHELGAYAKQRLTFGTMRLDAPEMPAMVAAGREAHGRLWAIVRRAIASKNTPTLHTPLVNAMNGVVAAHDHRLYGVRDQVPTSVFFMLILLGIFSMFTMGRLHDGQGTRVDGLLRVSFYVALVALVFAVIVDLEQPRRGMMLVSQEPMEVVAKSLASSP